MRPALYRYNAETCQYERVRTSPLRVLVYTFSVLLTAVVILGGLLIAHDFLFDSPKEVALRNENRALRINYATLSSDLISIERSLDILKREDQRLHTKFFGATASHDGSSKNIADQNVLLADPNQFRETVGNVREHAAKLIRHSAFTNAGFREKISIDATEAARLNAMPTLQPILPWDTDKLISGFGTRIDPYHKGLYEHPGIDIALPRGTEVVATAPGKIILARKSSIPAGYGNYVEIDHGGGFVTRYAHLEEIRVKQGQQVEKGMVIGTLGNSGGSVAPHLHYEILRDGEPVDPVPYMIEGMDPAEHQRLTQISKIQNQALD